METLRDKIKLDNNDNYILFEQGGIGKTSQMKAVFREIANAHEDGMVPIFVDCKSIDFNRKQPLLTHILLKFCGDDCPDNYDNSIVRLKNMLAKANSKYKYVFFIDGINECENNKYLVVQDIAKLLKSPNNKIIVSSRINEEDIGLKDFKRLKVKEFTDAQIITFLNSKGFKDNGNDVELNRLNPNLLKILRVPMFLKLFAETYSADNIFTEMYTSNIVRKADLLQAFINKIFDDKNEQHSSENDPEYIKRKFALEQYLPALAYEMMLMHKYSINSEALKNLRIQVFNSNYFERFENEDEVIFENISSIKEINNICIKEFSMLNKSNDNYTFSHQVWQDFFCGKFYELCIKYDILEPFENVMPESVRHFIGEIIEECNFTNVIDLQIAKKSPLNIFLQKHNTESYNPLSALATKNIIDIMKTSRSLKIRGNYDYLNLELTSFYSCNLRNSSFKGTFISESCFIPSGCRNSIKQVEFSGNGDYILILDIKNNIIIWNVEKNETTHFISDYIIEYLNTNIKKANFSKIYKYDFRIINSSYSTSFILVIKNVESWYVKIDCSTEKFDFQLLNGNCNRDMELHDKYFKQSKHEDYNTYDVNKEYLIKFYFDYKKPVEIFNKFGLVKTIDWEIFGKPIAFNVYTNTLACIINFDIILWNLNVFCVKERLIGMCIPISLPSSPFLEKRYYFLSYNDLKIRLIDNFRKKIISIMDTWNTVKDTITSLHVVNNKYLLLGGHKKLYVFNLTKNTVDNVIDEFDDGIDSIFSFKNDEIIVIKSGIDDKYSLKLYSNSNGILKIIVNDDIPTGILNRECQGFKYEKSINCLVFFDEFYYNVILYDCSASKFKLYKINEQFRQVFKLYITPDTYLCYQCLTGNLLFSIWLKDDQKVLIFELDDIHRTLVMKKEYEFPYMYINHFFVDDDLYILQSHNNEIIVTKFSLATNRCTAKSIKLSYKQRNNIESIQNMGTSASKYITYNIENDYVEVLENYDNKESVYYIDVLPVNIVNCDFRESKFGETKYDSIYAILEENGAIIPENIKIGRGIIELDGLV